MSADLLDEVREILQAGGIESVESEARRLVADAAGVKVAELTLEVIDDPSVRERALGMARRRARGEPLQYVTGIAGFRRLELRVGPGVFIPRPETEAVTEKAMELLPAEGTVVDLCTGSGAIALAISDERPDAKVLACEFSESAAHWARRNIERTGFPVELIRSDLFTSMPRELRGRIDVVVSNPPYIPEGDARLLPVEVIVHEPKASLFGGHDGLAVLTRIATEARDWLAPRRWLVLEMGDRQEDAVRKMLEQKGYKRVSIEEDLAGRPRIAVARRG